MIERSFQRMLLTSPAWFTLMIGPLACSTASASSYRNVSDVDTSVAERLRILVSDQRGRRETVDEGVVTATG